MIFGLILNFVKILGIRSEEGGETERQTTSQGKLTKTEYFSKVLGNIYDPKNSAS